MFQKKTFSFGLNWSSATRLSPSDEDCRSVRVKAHEVRKISMSLLFKRNCAIQQVLKAGTWSSQCTFSGFYF